MSDRCIRLQILHLSHGLVSVLLHNFTHCIQYSDVAFSGLVANFEEVKVVTADLECFLDPIPNLLYCYSGVKSERLPSYERVIAVLLLEVQDWLLVVVDFYLSQVKDVSEGLDLNVKLHLEVIVVLTCKCFGFVERVDTLGEVFWQLWSRGVLGQSTLSVDQHVGASI